MKRFPSSRAPDTRLKPGANERGKRVVDAVAFDSVELANMIANFEMSRGSRSFYLTNKP